MDKKLLLSKLEKEQKNILEKIHKIKREQEKLREKELENVVGCYVKGEYYKFAFRKIKSFVYNKKYGIYFIFEEIGINEQGEAFLRTTSSYPYINKEWSECKIPVSGWTEEITEEEYELNKIMVMQEMFTCSSLKKHLKKVT